MTLSISLPIKGAGAGDYYLKLARASYYANRIEEPGQWAGTGADRLGLSGEVEAAAFRNLLCGFSPDGKNPLVQNANAKDRQSGWDLTFSPDKSVSVLFGLASEDYRQTIAQCHHHAVRTALGDLERKAGITRRGKGGTIKEPAALIFATFRHITSRAQDPQLHTHCVLINLGLRADGTTGTLESRNMFRMKMMAGATYQRALAQELRQRLGLQIEPRKVGFHVVGVPESLCRVFSKRRQSIERVLGEWGQSDAVSAKEAALYTRPHKDQPPADQLFAEWQRVGKAFGWGQAQALELLQASAQGRPVAVVSRGEIKDEDLWRGLPDWEEQRAAAGQEPHREQGGLAPAQETARDQSRSDPRGTSSNDPQRPGPSVATGGSAKWDGVEWQPVDQGRSRTPRRYADQMFEADFWWQAGITAGWKGDLLATRQLAMRLAHQYGASQEATQRVLDELQARSQPERRHEVHSASPQAIAKAPFWSRAQFAKLASMKHHKHQARWGKVAWRAGFVLGELRIQRRPLFPDAPRWSPVHGKSMPALRVVFGRHHEQREAKHAWRAVLWERGIGRIKVRVQKKRLFPRAPKWSPAHAIELPAVRVVQERVVPARDAGHKAAQQQAHSH